jgi:hypothetical protein
MAHEIHIHAHTTLTVHDNVIQYIQRLKLIIQTIEGKNNVGLLYK